MSKVPFIITDHSVTFVVNNNPVTVDTSHPTYRELVTLLRGSDHDEARLVQLSTVAGAVEAAVATKVETGYLAPGRIVVTPTTVLYNGQPVHSALTERILDLIAEGFDIGPWVEFMSNLYLNPVDSAREELYEFLEASDLPLTPDGCFLAYKIVGDDYKDLYSSTFDNSVGQTVEMPRDQVDHDRTNVCSRGLHFCSKGYLPHYGVGGGSRVVIVKINPADVVSIPTDYDFAKGRTWKYEVVGEIERAEALIRRWEPVSYEFVSEDEDYDEDYDPDPVDEDELDYESDPLSPADEPVVESPVAGRLTAGVLLALRTEHGGSWNGVARHFGVSSGTVSSWVDKLGLRGQ